MERNLSLGGAIVAAYYTLLQRRWKNASFASIVGVSDMLWHVTWTTMDTFLMTKKV
jgi:hypothetical protein